MDRVLFYCFFFTSISWTLKASLRPGDEPLLSIALFQICTFEKETTENNINSDTCKKAIDGAYENKENFWQQTLEKGDFQLNNLIRPEDIDLKSFVFCTLEEGLRIVSDLKLNHSFHVSDKYQSKPRWNKKLLRDWGQLSKIVHVMVYASTEASQLFQYLFYEEEYVVSFLNQNFNVLSSLENKNLAANHDIIDTNAKFLYYRIGMDGKTLHGSNPLYYLGIVYCTNSSQIYQLEFETLYYGYIMKGYKKNHISHVMYQLDTSNVSDIDHVISSIDSDQELKFVIVIGDPEKQTKFFLRYGYRPTVLRTWVSYDFDMTTQKDYRDFVYFNFFNFEMFGDKFIENSVPSVLEQFLHDSVVAHYCYKSYFAQILRIFNIITVRSAMNIFQFMSFGSFRLSNRRKLHIAENGLRQVKVVFHGADLTFEYRIFQGSQLEHNHWVQIPTLCDEGYELYFGDTTHQNSNWTASFGWGCRPCSTNYFKSKEMLGNSSCLECPQMTISSEDRTFCFNPYQKSYISFQRPISKISLTLCSFGFLSALSIMIIFATFKDTPIVKAADFGSTMVHLSSHLLLFSILPYAFLGEPTNLRCFSRPLIVLLLCICPSTIIFAKLQKLLSAFNSKTVVSNSGRRRSSLYRFSFIAIILLIDSCMLLWTITIRRPRLWISYDHTHYEIEMTCTSGLHTNVQIAMLIIQQTFTAIQAFKGRNLPDTFNVTMSITYSTLAVTFAYVVTFPLFYLQRDPEVRQTVHLVLIAIAQTLSLLIFYGSRVFVILFRKERNTQSSFRREMFSRAQAKVELQIRK